MSNVQSTKLQIDDSEMHELSLNNALRKYESYLKLLAEVQIGRWMQARIGASDILQETLLDAAQGWNQFRGTTEAELVAWLKKILLNNINQAIEFHTARMRSVRREVSLDRLNAMFISSVALEEALCAQLSSPSAQLNRHEAVLSVADCLGDLSHKFREVILLRTLLGQPYAQVARKMEKSEAACRMLWSRAIKELRVQFERRNLL